MRYNRFACFVFFLARKNTVGAYNHGCGKSFSSLLVVCFASFLLNQTNIAYLNPLVNRFQHIVERKSHYRGGVHRFHFHTCFVDSVYFYKNMNF